MQRRKSDAMEAANNNNASASKRRQSPANSKKKKASPAAVAAATSVRSPSPAPIPVTSAASASTPPSSSRAQLRRNQQPDLSSPPPPPVFVSRPVRHLNSKDDEEVNATDASTDEEGGGAAGDSDNESVGSRVSRSHSKPMVSKPRGQSASTIRRPPSPIVDEYDRNSNDSARLNARSVRWDADAGIVKESAAVLVQPRKGSDHRRATVAAEKRAEAERLKILFDIQVSK